MTLPRNSIAKNTIIHNKKDTARQIIRKNIELNSLCDKHKIGNLTFRSCKFSDANGNITYLDHEYVKANMKFRVMIVKTIAMMPSSSDNIYDIVQIEKDKKERDEKKRQEELEKTKTEIERLKKANDTITQSEENKEHINILEKIDEGNIITNTDDRITEEFHDGIMKMPSNKISDDQISSSGNLSFFPNNVDNNVDNKDSKIEYLERCDLPKNKDNSTNSTNSTNSKREKALKQMKEQLDRHAESKGNKFFRNFMKDLRSKFILEEKPEYKFFEVKAETTDMVISNVKTYRIVMPPNTKETYLLIIGDLQMKTGLIRQIDPAYKIDKVLKEQNDFLEQIKAKEKSKTTILSENLLEEETDDLDQLGISNKEDIQPSANTEKSEKNCSQMLVGSL